MIKKAEERIVQESTPVIQDISYDEIWDALIKTLSKSFVGRNDLLIKVKNKWSKYFQPSTWLSLLQVLREEVKIPY